MRWTPSPAVWTAARWCLSFYLVLAIVFLHTCA